jgi:hypothetical protein
MESDGEASGSRRNHANLAVVPRRHQAQQALSPNQGRCEHNRRSYHTPGKGGGHRPPSRASHTILLGLTPSSRHETTPRQGALQLPQPAIKRGALSRHALMSA